MRVLAPASWIPAVERSTHGMRPARAARRLAGRARPWQRPGMAGASASTREITVVNANWTASPVSGDGSFALMVVTDDGERHVVVASPAAATALLALCASPARLMWDPESRTIIAGGIRGTWFA